MEANQTGPALRAFAEKAFSGKPFDIKEYEEAGEMGGDEEDEE